MSMPTPETPITVPTIEIMIITGIKSGAGFLSSEVSSESVGSSGVSGVSGSVPSAFGIIVIFSWYSR